MKETVQLFAPLDTATEAALRASIRRFGVLVPVTKDQDGRILDGHHRSRIADEEGVEFRVDTVTVADDDEAREIARTLNADRRHLSVEQRREMVVALREEGHSLRAIAGAVGASHVQVKRDLATVTQVTVPDRVVGLDGKSRPARRLSVVAPAASGPPLRADAQANRDRVHEFAAANPDAKQVEAVEKLGLSAGTVKKHWPREGGGSLHNASGDPRLLTNRGDWWKALQTLNEQLLHIGRTGLREMSPVRANLALPSIEALLRNLTVFRDQLDEQRAMRCTVTRAGEVNHGRY